MQEEGWILNSVRTRSNGIINGEKSINPIKLLNINALKEATTLAVLNPPRISRMPAITAKMLKLE